MIMAGQDAGQTGIVSQVHRDVKSPGVTVKGMNLVNSGMVSASSAAQLLQSLLLSILTAFVHIYPIPAAQKAH